MTLKPLGAPETQATLILNWKPYRKFEQIGQNSFTSYLIKQVFWLKIEFKPNLTNKDEAL